MGFRAAAEGGEMDCQKMASLRLLLSCGVKKGEKMDHETKTLGRLFECKTCNRRFPTFQALGGHRTSHRRPRVGAAQLDRMQSPRPRPKPRVHECPICGLEFRMGQALGGHMRRHKPVVAKALSRVHPQEKDGAGKALLLDLNLPPLEGDMEFQNLSLGVGFFEEVPMIDFLGCSASAY